MLLLSFLVMVSEVKDGLNELISKNCQGIGPEISQSVKDIYSAANVRPSHPNYGFS